MLFLEELLADLQEAYGKTEGLRLFNTVIPGIMGDFNKMLRKSRAGEWIAEEYRLDDGRGVIIVEWSRTANGEAKLKACWRP